VSANTYVTQQLWRQARKVVAGLAGALVSAAGITSTYLATRDLDAFNLGSGFSQVDLLAAPAGVSILAKHSTVDGAARLIDPALSDGLQPGESAYFGYTLALSPASVPVGVVNLAPVAVEGGNEGLTYEVRRVADATKCRVLWSAGQELVPSRAFTDPPSPTFEVARLTDAAPEGTSTQLCIRVSLSPKATASQTGSVTWRFVASLAA